MRQLYLTATALLVVGAFAACSSDDDAPMQQPAAEGLTIRASIASEGDTRLAFGDSDGNTTKMLWSAGSDDAFCLYGAWSSHIFTKENTDTEVATANFTCTDTNWGDMSDGDTYYAVYPALSNFLSLASQNGSLTSCLSKLPMVAECTWPADPSNLSLSFKHKAAVVKLALTHEDFIGKTVIVETSLEADGLVTHTDYDWTTGAWSQVEEPSHSGVIMTDKSRADENGTLTVYFYLFPSQLTNCKVKVKWSDDGAEFHYYEASLSDLNVQAGKLYKVTKTMTEIVQSEAFAFDYQSYVLTGLNNAIISTGLTKVKFVAGSQTTSDVAYTCETNPSQKAYIVPNGDCLEVHTSAMSFHISEATSLFDTEYHSDFSKLTEIDFNSCVTFSGTSTSNMFMGCSALNSITFGGYFTTRNVMHMSQMFWGCSGLTSLDLSNLDTPSVKYMTQMFYGCSGLTSLDLRSFYTPSAIYMNEMFSGCSALTSLDLSSFDTSNVTDMDRMFSGCSSLTSLDLSGFNTAKVTDMASMFHNCYALTSLDQSSFSTSNVTSMAGMFGGCYALTTLDLSGFSTSNVTSMNHMFNSCNALTSITFGKNFKTDNVTNMSYMFQNCKSLDELDLSGFTFAASNYNQMFKNLGYNSYGNNNNTPVAKVYVSSDGYSVLTGLTEYATTLGLNMATLEQKTE